MPVAHVVELSVSVLHPLGEDDVPVDDVEEGEEEGQHELGGRLEDGGEALLVRTRQVEDEGELGQLDEDEEDAGEHPHVQVGDVAHLENEKQMFFFEFSKARNLEQEEEIETIGRLRLKLFKLRALPES